LMCGKIRSLRKDINFAILAIGLLVLIDFSFNKRNIAE
jgi:hypothetical protein